MRNTLLCFFIFLSLSFQPGIFSNQNDVENQSNMKHIRLARGAIHSEARRWTKSVVYYTFSEWRSADEESDKEKIRDAMRLWSIATCVQFLEISDRELYRSRRRRKYHYLKIKNELYCGTDTLGMGSPTPGNNFQTLYLSTDKKCLHRGTILHELGHILGLIHEHQRPDRDEHLEVFSQNFISVDAEHQFEILPNAKTYKSIYDKRSVMHYEDSFMARNKNLKTFRTKDGSLVGKVYWKDISFYDAMVINSHYRCARKCNWPENCPRVDSYLDKNCNCITKTNFNEKSCVDHWRPKKCRQEKKEGSCNNKAEEMYMNCRQTCELCHIYPDQVSKKPVISDYVCKDKKKECRAWSRQGECTRNPRYMYEKCSASCNRCQMYNTSDPACFNIAANNKCDAWQAIGECTRNSAYMSVNCARACGLCQPSINSNQGHVKCLDSDSSREKCGEWKAIGFCETRKHAMSRKCAATCGFCQSTVPPGTISPMLLEACTRTREKNTFKQALTCKILKLRGMCRTSQQMMISKKCVEECGWCTHPAIIRSVTPSSIDCQDSLILMEKEKFFVASTNSTRSRSKCELWTERGFCVKASVKRLCRSSCGLCSTTSMTTSATNDS